MHDSLDPSLAGRRVLITGASGGIGSTTARLLSQSGCRLLLHFRSGADHARALLAELATNRIAGEGHPLEHPGPQEFATGADLRSETEVEALFAAASSQLGGLDSLVANAGVWPQADVPVSTMTLERWQETLATNLTAVFLSCRGFLRSISSATREPVDPTAPSRVPSIVVIGSTAGLFGEENHADYAAAKSALHGLVRSLKNEIVRVHPEARVNLVAPGWVATPMARPALEDRRNVARATSTIATGRVARPEDVAHAVRFLLSPLTARHVTGTILPVHGGMEGRLLHPAKLDFEPERGEPA